MVYFAQQTITVLVTDIRGFTSLSARMGETRISELISTFTRDSGRVLAEHGAWGQKFIGDAVMAVWVHPGDCPEPYELSAIMRALESLFRIAERMQSQFELDAPLRIGAGINTGVACVGNMGSDAGADYTALSDAVNLAFRLESATKELGCDVALGEQTYQYLAGHVEVSGLFERRMVELKGYKEPKPIYAAHIASLQTLTGALRKQQPLGLPDAN